MKITISENNKLPVQVTGIQNLTEGFWRYNDRIMYVGKCRPYSEDDLRIPPFMVIFGEDGKITYPLTDPLKCNFSNIDLWRHITFTKIESGSINIAW